MRSQVSAAGPGHAWPAAAGELTPRRRAIALGICCVSVLLVGIDMTAVNVALPSIGLLSAWDGAPLPTTPGLNRGNGGRERQRR
jgi:hypothetical protein